MTAPRLIVAGLALLAIALAIRALEMHRAGLEIQDLAVSDGTPATLFRKPDSPPAPTVVIAHGFAGSRQLMDAFSLTLAQAGYQVVSFDFMGHGRNPVPMSGDVTQESGTTQLLMAELARVAEAALTLPGADGRLAYLGHSMASDIVVRQAQRLPAAQATVAVSMFSRAVTAEAPADLLIIVGAFETMLREEALRALHLADPAAGEGVTVGDPAAGTGRRVVFAPGVEHVGVLYATTSLEAARDWLDAAFGRSSSGPVAARGLWIMLLLVAVIALAWPLSALLPRGTPHAGPLPLRPFLVAAIAPAFVVPLVLWPVGTRVLPVLVADYLVLHFALYGALTLGLLARSGALAGQLTARSLWIALAVAGFGILIFGGVLDRYVASFFPHAGRVPIIAGLALGSIAYMLGDALLTEGGRAGTGRVLLVRGAFLLSLGFAVALNFEALFFLVIILPVILLFFLLFGTMGGWVGRRTGLPAASGIGLGLVLAWALGVTFPLFAP
ncbi:MAG: alpha/beta fold hydrolase [Pseudomonadales bacterium]|jgi:dienelactone hydrolase|nr:alpha/beta fold hydrolase [Pseudomonadales bacterium]